MPPSPEVAPLRVCTIPGRHLYVDRCLVDAPGVRHLADPVGTMSYADPWRPSPALDPAWIAAHAQDIDVVHLHFGFEHRTPGQLRTWIETLAAHRIPLVFTVHDLDNPHLADQARHHRSLKLLIDAAAAVLTLTPGAADTIARRYGGDAQVVAHPHQFDLGLVGRRIRPRAGRGGRIGLNLRSMRPNVDGPAALSLLRHAPDGVQVVVRTPDSTLTENDPLGTLVLDGARTGHWDIDPTSGYAAEQELWEFVSGLDALLLPYRWGAHSGWVESCWDVGTAVVAPPVGFLDQQHPVVELALGAGPEIVERVLGELHPAGGATPPARRAERAAVADAHARVYRQVQG